MLGLETPIYSRHTMLNWIGPTCVGINGGGGRGFNLRRPILSGELKRHWLRHICDKERAAPSTIALPHPYGRCHEPKAVIYTSENRLA